MPDEATEAPAVDETQDTPTETAEDTPEVEAPEQSEQQTQEEVDYEKRYQDLQPEYTRATQEAAQYRQIIELAQQGDRDALELLGLEVEEQDTEDEDSDQPITRAEWQQYQDQQAQERQADESEQAFNDDLWAAVEAIEEKEGREISDEEASVLRDSAIAQVVRGGTFDLSQTWDALRAQDKEAVERYVNSKKQARTAPLGSAGDRKIDTSTPEGRKAAIAEIAEANFSDDS